MGMEPEKQEDKPILVPTPAPDKEDYTVFLEWTPEEEEAFLKIIADKGSEFL